MAHAQPPALSLVGALTDEQLLTSVSELARLERRASARLIAALAEVDRRRLYLPLGYASMFAYCTEALHLSEHGAYNRIEAARVGRRFPVVLELLEDGAVTVTTIRLLAPALTAENHEELLAAARHKSRRDVETLLARLRPRSDVATVIRRLPDPPALPVELTDSAAEGLAPKTSGSPAPKQPPANSGRAPDPPAKIAPPSPERYLLQLTLSKEAHDLLRHLQALLRHSIPDGDVGQIIHRALHALLTDARRTKFAATARPRPSAAAVSHSRHIPAAVKRELWKRDGGRCAFTGTGCRCREEAFLEYHHLVPFAAGGATTMANIELRCRAHNAYEADQFFGRLELEGEA